LLRKIDPPSPDYGAASILPGSSQKKAAALSRPLFEKTKLEIIP